MLSHYAVHSPIEADPRVLSEVQDWPQGQLHRNSDYAAMIKSLDDSVGRVLAALDDAGLTENTLVVFASDNGGGRRVTTMQPLKGSKGELNEGGIRVPCIVKYPGVVAPGQRTDTPVQLFDLYPTLLEFAGADAPQDQPIDGTSWARLMQGRQDAALDRGLIWFIPVYTTTPNGQVTQNPSIVIRRGPWKLIHDYQTDSAELYHLLDDVSEADNVAQERSEIADALANELREWETQTDAALPSPNPDYDPDAAPPATLRGNRGDRANRNRTRPRQTN